MLTNFNLSVGRTEAFREKVDRGEDSPLINPRTRQVTRYLPAREVFDLMCHYAVLTGDPGVLFLDAIERANPTPTLGRLEATNPCGEQPLLPYESCNLASINLSRLVTNGAPG